MAKQQKNTRNSKNSNKHEVNPKDFLNFREIKLTESQQQLYDKIYKNHIIFAYGPAGSSKTFSTMYTCLKLYSEGKVGKIILTKPIEESGDKVGFLKGTLEEKIEPYTYSFFDNIGKIIGQESIEMLTRDNVIEFKPLSFMRGSSFDNTIMILDEAQNCDFRQLMLYITRMGKNSKVIVLGDISQHDIKKDRVALPHFIKMIEGIRGVDTHEFTKEDIVRNKILIEITDRYEQWIADNKITLPKN
jgi:phosphate starvation-inducible PhoH-like protein